MKLSITVIVALCVAMCALRASALCNCWRIDSQVSPNLISGWKTEAPRPFCNKVEVIVTLKNGRKVCIQPNGELHRYLVNLRKQRAKDESEVRCNCRRIDSQVSLYLISGWTTEAPRPYCNKVEVIVALKNGRKVCIEPNGQLHRYLVNLRRQRAKDQSEVRCNCRIDSQVSLNLISTWTTIAPRPYCNKVEVIVALKNGRKVCIKPNGQLHRYLVNLRRQRPQNAAKKSVRTIAPSPSSTASVQTLQTTTTVTPAASTKE